MTQPNPSTDGFGVDFELQSEAGGISVADIPLDLPVPPPPTEPT